MTRPCCPRINLPRPSAAILLVAGAALLTLSPPSTAQEWKSGVEFAEPPVVTPGASDRDAPSDAIVLFDGANLDQWDGGEQWRIEDGVAIPQGGEIRTKRSFGDVQLHLEWAAPAEVEGRGQGRGNSGIYFMGVFELQILDSFENPTYFDGQAGAIYKQTPPLANAMRKPGEWNSYDVIFIAPRFRLNGAVATPAFLTAFHNGVAIQHHFELLGHTSYTEPPQYKLIDERGPLALQFHGDPVRFRNIWVRELTPIKGVRTGPPFNLAPKSPPPAAATQDGNS